MKRVTYRRLSSIGVVFFFFVMLVFPRQVFLGAQNGLLLWFHTVLPALLPFSIISNILIETNSIKYISNAFGPVLRPIFHVTDQGVFVIVVGFLCGYPLGAKVIAMLLEKHYISYEEGCYLLSFCNNVSPIFIINFLVCASLKRPNLIFPVVTILILTPVCCSFLFRVSFFTLSYKKQFVEYHRAVTTQSISQLDSTSAKIFDLTLFNHCMMDSFEIIVVLGGYIMLFSIFFTLLGSLSDSLHLSFLSYLLPLLEVTNGITLIQTFSLSFPIKLLFTLSITSFGGLCALFQTKHVLQGTGISIGNYAIKKLVTMLVTSLLTLCYLFSI